MILLVDAGNTRIKWALWDGRKITQRGDLLHREIAREELGQHLWATLTRPERVLIANVAGAEVAAALNTWINRTWSLEACFVSTMSSGFGVRCAYARPQRLGVDRWTALVGARALTTQACCIVDCGTAVTIDALAADGQHLGGVIFPGVRLMRESLYRDTRQIPPEPGQATLFGCDTNDGVWGGAVYATAAAIDGITARMMAVLGVNVCRLLTGGDGEMLLPYLQEKYRLEPDLIFQGLIAMTEPENTLAVSNE